MPRSTTESGSSIDFDVSGDHLVDSVHQETLLVMAYLQDMVLSHIVFVDRIAIAPPATETASSISSDTKGLRPWLFPFFYTVSIC
jgi:hypothetical protein